MKMVLLLVLLLLGLTSVCGLSLFEAVEGANITLRWDSPDQSDLSGLHMNCRLRSRPEKSMFFMVGGVVTYQDQQFSGRVEFNREALKQGQVQIHVTGLRPQDSGEYLCEMAATDPDRREWVLTSTEDFKLEVTPKDAVSMTTPASGGEVRQTPAWTLLLPVAVVVCLTSGIVGIICLKRFKRCCCDENAVM